MCAEGLAHVLKIGTCATATNPNYLSLLNSSYERELGRPSCSGSHN